MTKDFRAWFTVHKWSFPPHNYVYISLTDLIVWFRSCKSVKNNGPQTPENTENVAKKKYTQSLQHLLQLLMIKDKCGNRQGREESMKW
jgi:hypothetical protein